MNSLTKVTMAMLCTLLIACSTHEYENDLIFDEQVQSRTSDLISINYLAQDGSSITESCTNVEIDYSTSSTSEFTLIKNNGTQTTCTAASATVTVSSGYALELTVDGSTILNVSDLTTEICDELICYSNSEGTVIGTGLEIIIDEMPEGL